MTFQPGDSVHFVSTPIGTVREDPTNSFASILIDFNGTLIRIPRDGTLASGIVRLVLVPQFPEEIYEQP